MEELNIGEKIKRLRKAQNLTQEELADRADLTKGFISQLERDLTSPSIATLAAIVDVLGVKLADFFEDSHPETYVFRMDQRVISSASTEGVEVMLMVPSAQMRHMDPVIVTLKPGSKTALETSHEGEEFGTVLKGQVILHLDRPYRVQRGDCFYFDSGQEHWMENPGKVDAVIIWVVSPPVFY